MTTIRTGVLVGLPPNVTEQAAATVKEQLEQMFPGVAFAVGPFTSCCTFTYDDTGTRSRKSRTAAESGDDS